MGIVLLVVTLIVGSSAGAAIAMVDGSTASATETTLPTDAQQIPLPPTDTPTPDPPETDRQNLTTQRTLSATEVTNGSTVTVTVEATFNSTIDDANLVDNINGQGVSADNITITDADGDFSAVTSDPAVDITDNDELNVGLDSESLTVEYELTIPEDTPVGTTITFDGTVTNNETDETAGIDGDSSLEVVASGSGSNLCICQPMTATYQQSKPPLVLKYNFLSQIEQS